MIPLRLQISHFLSYQRALVQFEGLHTACICGANGAGKSSLLEAITWALWGQSRVSNDDDLIHGGEQEVHVDFIFRSHQQVYRVWRSRRRKQGTVLEFQVAQDMGMGDGVGVTTEETIALPYRFRSLTEKGVRATQQAIIQTLKLDYDTFINSAYLRQGRADEFMLKRPAERKQVLADLLKLHQYDALADRAKERAREFKTQSQWLGERLHSLDQDLERQRDTEHQLAQARAKLERLAQQRARSQQDWEGVQRQVQERQRQEEEMRFLHQQRHQLAQERQQQQAYGQQLRETLTQMEGVLGQGEQIQRGYGEWQRLQGEEQGWQERSSLDHHLQAQGLALQRQWEQQRQDLVLRREKLQTQVEQIQRQQRDLEGVLAQRPQVEEGLSQLRRNADRLREYDRLQGEVAPLFQRHQALIQQRHQWRTQLQTRLDGLRLSLRQLHDRQAEAESLDQTLTQITQQVTHLEQRKRYLEQLRDKGQERKTFLERLQAHHQDYTTQLEELEQRQHSLSLGTPCPLCQQPLDEAHWEQVSQQYLQQRQELVDMLWVIADQVRVSDREIQVLRQEYGQVYQEVAPYDQLLGQRGELYQRLLAAQEAKQQYDDLLMEVQSLEEQQRADAWDAVLQQELGGLSQSLEQLAYDDRSHALARGEVERWRWAEVRYAELEQAQAQWLTLGQQRPPLEAQLTQVDQQLQHLDQGELWQAWQQIHDRITQLGYCRETHDRLRQALREHQDWPLHYQTWQQAQTEAPKLQAQLNDWQQIQTAQHQRDQDLAQQLEHLTHHLQAQPNPQEALTHLEQIRDEQRRDWEQSLRDVAHLEAQQQQYQALIQQREQQYQQRQACDYQQQLYQELSQAFGKNGLQALLIENLLPQLEIETNQILARLSGHQHHVQFITQRARRSGGSDKLIETLDIRIGDAQGTRPYETYSGGEAFRVNFAIRLALARLLAQRSGSPLQLLIVDEGFGTQDTEGCDRLIAAINAIADDFACILAITHMPQFKEAFQTRLEVEKTAEGSHVRVIH